MTERADIRLVTHLYVGHCGTVDRRRASRSHRSSRALLSSIDPIESKQQKSRTHRLRAEISEAKFNITYFLTHLFIYLCICIYHVTSSLRHDVYIQVCSHDIIIIIIIIMLKYNSGSLEPCHVLFMQKYLFDYFRTS